MLRSGLFVLGAAFIMSSVAQDGGPKTVKAIQDVKVGMQRSVVLSGLGQNYQLVKINKDEPDANGIWFAYGLHPEKFEKAEIDFIQDKVFSVTTTLYPPMNGEAIRFTEHLFFLLRDRAGLSPFAQKVLKDPNAPPSVAAAFANSKHLDLPVDLFYSRSDKVEKMTIDFKAGEDHFMIEIDKVEGFPDTVEIQKYTDLTEVKAK